MNKIVRMLVGPFMNQRGEVGVADPTVVDPGVVVPETPDLGIGGTGFKSPEELASGYQSLMKKLGEQGNELGSLRKEKETLGGHAETLASILKEQLTKSQAVVEPKTNYDAELSTVEQEIQKLDPMTADYSRSLSALVSKSNRLSALAQHEKTLAEAGNLMKKELSDRDVKSSQKAFHDENPTFNTPEMQAKIKEYIAKDKTAMHDPLSAFFQIQRDEVSSQASQLAKENEDMRKLLELNKGKEEAGKVVVKSQGTAPAVKPGKVTGKDLDAGMMARLQALS
jgi:hypothetical protein